MGFVQNLGVKIVSFVLFVVLVFAICMSTVCMSTFILHLD